MRTNKMICLMIAIMMLVTNVFAIEVAAFTDVKGKAEFSDIKGHWAEQTIKNHQAKGMLKGYPDGTFKPDQEMKRSELITLINRYFGLENGSSDNFLDVNSTAWYAEETAKAKYYEYIKSLNVEPNLGAKREDVVQMIALIIDIEEQKRSGNNINFSDIEDLSEEKKQNIESFAEMGYIKGYPGGIFDPDKIINRAEIMTIAESVLGYIVTSQSDLDNIPKDVKKISIITPNIKIENLNTNADVYISPGVNGGITIKDSIIKGKLEIAGGTTKKPIKLKNVQVDKVIITKAKEKPIVKTESSDINELKVKAESKVDTDEKTVINTAKIESKSKLTGKGEIKKAYVSAKDVVIEKKPAYVEITEKNIVLKVADKEMVQDSDDKNAPKDTKGNRKKRKIAVTEVVITDYRTQGAILTATVKPEGATVNYKWQRDIGVGEESQFVDIEGATSNTYLLTKDDVDKEIRVVATGTGKYKGEVVSNIVGPIEEWIPIANKAELKQIEIAAEQTFGAGTKWEGTYTGGMDKKYMLVADIDLIGENFIPIGYNEATDTSIPFTGSFTGDGFHISNLNIERNKELQGLFSILGNGAFITDISIKNVSMKTSSRSGVLAGEAEGAKIVESKISNVEYDLFASDPSNPSANEKKAIGGFVGKGINTEFMELELSDFVMELTDKFDCYSLLKGVGGIAGILNGGEIRNSQVKDIKLEAIHDRVNRTMYFLMCSGGLVGQLNNSSTKTLIIDNSTVTNLDLTTGGYGAPDNGGGFIGEINTNDKEVSTNGDIQVTNCSSSGTIKGKGYLVDLGTILVGGFAGYVDGGGTPKGDIDISNCSSSVEISELMINPSYVDIAMSKGGVGGFAGRLKDAKVVNCHATGDIGKKGDFLVTGNGDDIIDEFLSSAGGFSGWIDDSDVQGCYATGSIIGSWMNGGFAGIITEKSNVSCCYATGNITNITGGFYTGGFSGWIMDSTIIDSYSTGNVDMDKNQMYFVGSFAGDVSGDSKLSNIYSIGKLTGIQTEYANGFARFRDNNVSFKSCYWNKTANPTFPEVPTGSVDIQGKTEEKLKSITTFINWDISDVSAGSDTIWLIEEGIGYPYLK